MRDLFASKHCMGQYSINCWTTDGEYTLVVRPIGSSPTQSAREKGKPGECGALMLAPTSVGSGDLAILDSLQLARPQGGGKDYCRWREIKPELIPRRSFHRHRHVRAIAKQLEAILAAGRGAGIDSPGMIEPFLVGIVVGLDFLDRMQGDQGAAGAQNPAGP